MDKGQYTLSGRNKNQKHARGFSLIEMIIVLGIISIIFIIIRINFQSPTIYKSQAYSCVEYGYGFMQSYLYAGLAQRGFSENGEYTFPQDYYITIVPYDQTIKLYYDNGILYDTYNISGSIQQGCKNTNYRVVLTGQEITIHITNRNMTANTFTGEIGLLFCTREEECQGLGSISFDTRTQQLMKHDCSEENNTFCQ